MNGTFDIYTLLFLVLAIVIFLRLRSVLGRRTGNERPPYDPYSRRQGEQASGPGSGDDNVISLPRGGEDGPGGPGADDGESAEDRIRDFMPQGGPVAEGLVEIAKHDAMFDPKQFLAGAKTAYEMIVTAFAEGNRRSLKQLLSRDVYDGFVSAIDERDERGETVESSFIGINKADVIEAEIKSRSAQITVKFVSQIITAIRNRKGELVEGDPNQVREVTDIWTFARELASRDPNWKLVATQTAN